MAIFPLKPPKQVCPQFFLMKATVQIHKAQRTHLCSTHYILYKLDMYNPTECPIPLIAAHDEKSL